MNEAEQQRLLDLGKELKKFFEDVTINTQGYKVNNRLFYLAIYTNKFSDEPKAYGVLSLENHKQDEAQAALFPLLSYFVTWTNISEAIGHRAQVDFTILGEVRDYLERIVNDHRITSVDKNVYKRSLNIIQNMLDLQKKMKQLWQDTTLLDERSSEKGFFDDEEIEQLILNNIEGHWIQYAQFKDRYDNCSDFDIIYDNRSIPEIKEHESFTKKKTLYNMRSHVAADQLKQSIDHMTEGKAPMDYEMYMDHFYKVYKERLQQRFEKAQKMLRYP